MSNNAEEEKVVISWRSTSKSTVYDVKLLPYVRKSGGGVSDVELTSEVRHTEYAKTCSKMLLEELRKQTLGPIMSLLANALLVLTLSQLSNTMILSSYTRGTLFGRFYGFHTQIYCLLYIL
jgi:hypothetical protein